MLFFLGRLIYVLSSVFLIDHCWTYRLGDARKCLTGIPGLAERLGEMMEIPNCPDLEKSELIELVIKYIWK